MKNSLRQQFLDKWERYPSYICGEGYRYLGFSGKQCFVLSLSGDRLEISGNWKLYSGVETLWKEVESKGLDDYFTPGDWILCDGDFEVSGQQLEAKSSSAKVYLAAPNKKADFPLLSPRFSHWNQFLEFVRFWFLNRKFQSVVTPSLVASPGMEPTLDVFETQWEIGEKREPFYLPTSPELHLKKMLARGSGSIFEIKKVFRNQELSSQHQPEFLMLEFYRSFANLNLIAEDLQLLIQDLISHGFSNRQDKPCVRLVSVADLFLEYLSLELKPNSTQKTFQNWASQHGVRLISESFDDNFHQLFVEKIDPQLKSQGTLFVKDFPPSQAALARLTTEGWADRLELYIDGVEVANGFNELNDPEEQKKRFLRDQEERIRLGKKSIPVDNEFLDHLESGLPPSAGVAVGLERLFMSLNGIENINEFLEFPKKSLY